MMSTIDATFRWKVVLSLLLLTLASGMVAPSSLKIRVCQGSSCMGKCRGIFNPLTSFEELAVADKDSNDLGGEQQADVSTSASIDFEESFCMNQCKRGPNVRLINSDNGTVMTFDATIMNEMEANRKAFQGVTTEERVNRLWGIAKGVVDGSVVASEKGSAENLHDIMPKK